MLFSAVMVIVGIILINMPVSSLIIGKILILIGILSFFGDIFVFLFSMIGRFFRFLFGINPDKDEVKK